MIQRIVVSLLLAFGLLAPLAAQETPPPPGPPLNPPPTRGELVELIIPIPERQVDDPQTKPSAEHVWVSGYWRRMAGDWRWERGSWKIPPFEGAQFVRGHWVQEGEGWRWAKAYWAVGQERQVVADPIPKPPAPNDVKLPQPSSDAVWIPGRWEWRDGWRWALGHWATPPEPGATWVEGEWVATADERWRWMPSHWRRAD